MNDNPGEPVSVTGLTISELADRTGVPPATLRTWESRYGAPLPARLPGGHRRYGERDAVLVEHVVGHRAMGLSLETAIARAVAQTAEPDSSVFAGLRRRHDALVPQILTKRTLLAVTRAIEDECCARAAHPILFAGFQRSRFYLQSQSRWTELARTAEQVVVFADFAEQRGGESAFDPADAGGVTCVPVPADAPLGREWLVVCDAANYPACLTGWEFPGQDAIADPDRRYEAMWTVDPGAVRDAARICMGLAESFARPSAPGVIDRLERAAPHASPDLHRATSMFNRVLSYVDASGEGTR